MLLFAVAVTGGYFAVVAANISQFNHLSGELPASLGQLGQLEELHASCNRLTGTFPWTLGNLVYLRVLDVKSNQMSGPFHTEAFGTMRNLVDFNYSDNNFVLAEDLAMYINDDWVERIYNAEITSTKKVVTFYKKILDLWQHYSLIIQCGYRYRAANRKVAKMRRVRDANIAAGTAMADAAHIATLAAHTAIASVMVALDEEAAAALRQEVALLHDHEQSWKGRAVVKIVEVKQWLQDKREEAIDRARQLRSAEAKAEIRRKLRKQLEPLTDNRYAEALAGITRRSQAVLAQAGGVAMSGAQRLQPVVGKGVARSVRLVTSAHTPVVRFIKDELNAHNEGTDNPHYFDRNGHKRDSIGPGLRAPAYYQIDPRYRTHGKYAL